jgi:chemotaxis protein MotB
LFPEKTMLMKRLYTFCLLAASSSLLFFHCVSNKKYKASQNKIDLLRSDSSYTHHLLSGCDKSLTECGKSLKSTQDIVAQLSDKNTSVLKDLQDLSANSQMTISAQAKRLADMQKVIAAQKVVMGKLKQTVSDALVGFSPEELGIEIKNGNIYVSLQEKLLFKSGSDQVDPKGKDALQKLSSVLKNNTDINVNIEGHTDNVPIKGKFTDNWALSVSRATSIVRILTNEGVDPQHVVASGRGEYFPIEPNTTVTGKARNRRTEIILSPNLTELFKLLDQ